LHRDEAFEGHEFNQIQKPALKKNHEIMDVPIISFELSKNHFFAAQKMVLRP